MTTIAAPHTPEPTLSAPGWSPWRLVAATALAVAIVADVALMAIHAVAVPPLIVFGLVGVGGATLLPRGGKTGPILVVVAALVPALTGAPFYLPGLAHPESAVDFVHAGFTVVLRAAALVAGAAMLRGAGPQAARPTATVAAVLVGAIVVTSAVATATTSSDLAQPGDVPVHAVDSSWTEATITVATGETVAVENADAFRHTFTVDGVGIDVELPSGTTRRVEIDLAPGTYALRCTVPGHDDMVAELIVG